MIRELRQIHFQASDLVAAFGEFRDGRQEFLPNGEIRILGVAKNGAIRLQVAMSYGRSQQSAAFDIGAEDVLRVLINACSGQGIPVPRNGEKSLVGGAKGVCLNIKIDPAANPDSAKNSVSLDGFNRARALQSEDA